MRTLTLTLAALGLTAGLLAAGPSQAIGELVDSSTFPPIEKVGDGLYRLGDIVVNKRDRSITFPARVNMDSGMLEYLLVHRRGKTHESLFNTLIEPYSLQIAFLLLGYEGAKEPLTMQGDPTVPQGEALRILVTPASGGAPFPADQWVMNRFGDEIRDVPPMKWVYTGSFSFQGRFMPQESGSVVAIWHDPAAMIDNATPGGESNRIWFVKEGTVPAVDTPVTLTLLPAQ